MMLSVSIIRARLLLSRIEPKPCVNAFSFSRALCVELHIGCGSWWLVEELLIRRSTATEYKDDCIVCRASRV